MEGALLSRISPQFPITYLMRMMLTCTVCVGQLRKSLPYCLLGARGAVQKATRAAQDAPAVQCALGTSEPRVGRGLKTANCCKRSRSVSNVS